MTKIVQHMYGGVEHIQGDGYGETVTLESATCLLVEAAVLGVGGASGANLKLYWARAAADDTFVNLVLLADADVGETVARLAKSIGPGLDVAEIIGQAGRFVWDFTGAGIATTVTTGANSATQLIGDTTGILPGDTLHFGTANVDRVVDHVVDGTHVVLTAAVNSTTSEAVTTTGPTARIQHGFQADGR